MQRRKLRDWLRELANKLEQLSCDTDADEGPCFDELVQMLEDLYKDEL